MNPAKILLLDLNSADDLSNTLLAAFESPHTQYSIQFRSEKVNDNNVAFPDTDLLATIACFQPDIILLAVPRNLNKQAQAFFQAMRRKHITAPVIPVVETSEADRALNWLKLGAADFIPTSISSNDILARVCQLLEQVPPGEVLAQRLRENLGMRLLIGKSSAFLEEINKIPLLAKCNASVLIAGETGTGKELCARAIHYLGPRAHKPFIPVNCGAIPADLVENELFGHERGAFTGAKNSKIGLIQEADGGTLFLDEIDCLPLLSQVKLLRFLQEKEYRPLGSTKVCQADVRVIAATNSDPEEAVKAGKLRQDFYYRLNVIPLLPPPLRARREDVPGLARYFLHKFAAELDKPVAGFSIEAIQSLVAYDWPGNVRELEHIVMRAVALSTQPLIRAADLTLPNRNPKLLLESFKGAKNKVVAEFEKSYIKKLLLMYDGNISRAAQAAQKNRRAFWQLIRKHRIDVKSLRASNF
ncbi:MAG: hypothetical protein AUG51_25710 [Acidobacteria bacterium 13_1_20CM_3_53_8]|nr:MAG: hypothetical protein AUG51_25710 [Acidobacteria bacterium 13_1_20CM_3_53_8]